MANPLHVQILLGGVETVNDWAAANPRGWLDLREADLPDLQLSAITVWRPDGSETMSIVVPILDFADFRGARLVNANLSGAQMRGASFVGADLTGAAFTGACLVAADFSDARLEDADFVSATVDRCRLPTAARAAVANPYLRGAPVWV
jgi:uncharacterized protein YjbI with pentapeptide repeats